MLLRQIGQVGQVGRGDDAGDALADGALRAQPGGDQLVGQVAGGDKREQFALLHDQDARHTLRVMKCAVARMLVFGGSVIGARLISELTGMAMRLSVLPSAAVMAASRGFAA